ncbi:GUN4 domain-containing protein [Rubidibacter lacunae]|nr:GUN4 domain-containing protein [Rubidibacter lacunae]
MRPSRLDYSRLNTLLEERSWHQANLETLVLLLNASHARGSFWIRINEVDRIPATTLRLIDRLWVNNSHGHFGFSVQGRILSDLSAPEYYEPHTWGQFADLVGWRKQGIWIDYCDLNLALDAPTGHLPRIDPMGKHYPGISYIWLLGALRRKLIPISTKPTTDEANNPDK